MAGKQSADHGVSLFSRNFKSCSWNSGANVHWRPSAHAWPSSEALLGSVTYAHAVHTNEATVVTVTCVRSTLPAVCGVLSVFQNFLICL